MLTEEEIRCSFRSDGADRTSVFFLHPLPPGMKGCFYLVGPVAHQSSLHTHPPSLISTKLISLTSNAQTALQEELEATGGHAN